MTLWNKGRFGFWIVGKSYMRRRDAVQMTLLEAQGQRKECERIIKLLEQEIDLISNPMLVDREYLDGLEEAIALIKGEQK